MNELKQYFIDELNKVNLDIISHNNMEEYAEKELIKFYTKPKVIKYIALSEYNNYLKVLELNNDLLIKLYTSNEFFNLCRLCGTLDDKLDHSRIGHALNYEILEIFLKDKENLKWCGDKFLAIYNEKMLRNHWDEEPKDSIDDGLFGITGYVRWSENNELIFEVLDFYLENAKYLPVFKCLINMFEHKGDDSYNKYLLSRKELITKVIKKNPDAKLNFIIDDWLPIDILKREIFHERDNLFLNYNSSSLYHILAKTFNGEYELSDEIIKNPKFLDGFIYTFGLPIQYKQSIREMFKSKDTQNYIIREIEELNCLRNKIMEKIGENEFTFGSYLEAISNCDINPYEVDFLNDMHSVIIKCNRIREVYEKYKNIDTKLLKKTILNDAKQYSLKSITNSIDNPLDNLEDVEYMLEGRKVVIPTRVYDGEKYVFLVKTMENEKTMYGNLKKCYSIITDKNRSMYYGNSRLRVGFVKVKPEDIIQVNDVDAISQDYGKDKYHKPGLKYPQWIALDKLNKYTLKYKTYNEIRIVGEYIPDFVICFDEPDEKTLNFAYKYERPLVKILRKSYPNAIENNDDIYSDWQ